MDAKLRTNVMSEETAPQGFWKGGKLRAMSALGVGALLLATMTACGGASGGEETAEAEATVPDYYPENYTDLVEASKQESGSVSLYSNVSQSNLKPLIDGFQAKFPWIKVGSAGDWTAEEVIQRFTAETAQGTSDADLLITAVAGNVWEKLLADDKAMEYDSPETEFMPEGTYRPGLYSFASDPLVIIYNTKLLAEDKHPSSLADLVALSESDPDTFRDKKMITYDASGFGFSGAYGLTEEFDFGWDTYEKLSEFSLTGPISGGDMLERVSRGENLIAYMTSGRTAYTGAANSQGIIEVSLINDAQVMFNRGMMINEATKDPASSKLFLDYILSEEGQRLIGEGKSTPVREGLELTEGIEHTVETIAAEVGEDKMTFVGIEGTEGDEEFIAKFHSLMGVN